MLVVSVLDIVIEALLPFTLLCFIVRFNGASAKENKNCDKNYYDLFHMLDCLCIDTEACAKPNAIPDKSYFCRANQPKMPVNDRLHND